MPFGLGLGLGLSSFGGGGAFNPNSIAGLNQLLFVSETALLSGYITDERTGLGDDRARRGGQVYDFDGTDDYISTPLTHFTDMTMCTWVKCAIPSAKATPICQWNSASSMYRGISINNTTGKASFQISVSGGSNFTATTATVADNTWHHIAMTYTGGTFNLYVDGVLDKTVSITDATTWANIGRGALFRSGDPTGIQRYDGLMWDTRFYNLAKDAGEIAAIVAGDYAAPDTTGLVAGYWCNEEDGTVSYDWSGNGNHGTITNATLATFHATDADVDNPADFVGYTPFYSWDDVDDSKIVIPQVTLSGDFNISFKTFGFTTGYFFSGDTSADRFYHNAGTFTLFADASSVAYTASVPSGVVEWSLVRTGTSVELFINGVSQGVETLSGDLDITTIGNHGTYPSAFPAMNGIMYDLNINDVQIMPLRGTAEATTGSDGVATALSNIIVPRDESDTANDVLGNLLQYSGEAPYPGQAINSPCLTFDGVDDYIAAAHLSGSETVVRSGGTSTPSISAGRIDFTAGTCWDLELSDGTHYPLSENSGETTYDVSGNGNHGTITNATTSPAGTGAWANTQDVFHYFLSKGGTLSTGTETTSTFDSDLDGWTSYWVNVYWVASAHSMTGLAYIQAENSSTNDARLGRTFTLGGDATLTVVSKYQGGDDGFSLLVKDNGTTISTTAVASGMGGVPSLNLSLPLTGAGEHIIEFVITGGNGDAIPGGWWIDSVTVTEGVVGLEVPALADGTADAQGNAITNPAGAKHNGGITDLTLIDGTWSFNDARTNPYYKRTLTSDAIEVAADRFASFEDTLTGDDETNMDTYTETTEI